MYDINHLEWSALSLANASTLAIPVLQRHIRFLIDKHNSFLEDSGEEESATDTFSTAWTRSMLAVVVEKGSRHLTQVCTDNL